MFSSDVSKKIQSAKIASLLLLVLFSIKSNAQELATVEATGVGIDERSAQSAAIQGAVRKVISAYLGTGDSVTKSAEIDELVLRDSVDFVARQDIRSPAARRPDGLWEITASSEVRRPLVVEKLREIGLLNTAEEEFKIWMQEARGLRGPREARDFLQRFLKGLPKKLMLVRVLDDQGRTGRHADFVKKPEGDKVVVGFWVQTYFNMNAYLKWVLPVLRQAMSVVAERDCGPWRWPMPSEEAHVAEVVSTRFFDGNYHYCRDCLYLYNGLRGGGCGGGRDRQEDRQSFVVSYLDEIGSAGRRLVFRSYIVDKEWSESFSPIIGSDGPDLGRVFAVALDEFGRVIVKRNASESNWVENYQYVTRENAPGGIGAVPVGDEEYVAEQDAVGKRIPLRGWKKVSALGIPIGDVGRRSMGGSLGDKRPNYVAIVPLFLNGGTHSDVSFRRLEVAMGEEEAGHLREIVGLVE